MTVLEYMQATFNPKNEYDIRRAIVCNDGFTVSVQGGTRNHYCDPRCHENKYKALELGYPSEADGLIAEYADDSENLTDTVYGYVPLDLVEQLIQKHGGINCEATFVSKGTEV